jgi:hypothetical protein
MISFEVRTTFAHLGNPYCVHWDALVWTRLHRRFWVQSKDVHTLLCLHPVVIQMCFNFENDHTIRISLDDLSSTISHLLPCFFRGKPTISFINDYVVTSSKLVKLNMIAIAFKHVTCSTFDVQWSIFHSHSLYDFYFLNSWCHNQPIDEPMNNVYSIQIEYYTMRKAGLC